MPALSVETIVKVLDPAARVNAFEKLPLSLTVTDTAALLLCLMVTVHGLDVTSLVVPDTVQDVLFVTRPLAGVVTDSVGATVSILNVTDFCAAALPS